jgi:hypothetical protein
MGDRGSCVPARRTSVKASSPRVDIRLPAGTSTSETLVVPVVPAGFPAPVTNTRPPRPEVTSSPLSEPVAKVCGTPASLPSRRAVARSPPSRWR